MQETTQEVTSSETRAPSVCECTDGRQSLIICAYLNKCKLSDCAMLWHSCPHTDDTLLTQGHQKVVCKPLRVSAFQGGERKTQMSLIQTKPRFFQTDTAKITKQQLRLQN